MNAKSCPPRIIHAVVKIQASIRRFQSFDSGISLTPYAIIPIASANPQIALALYLSRRLRYGQYMDVEGELDNIAEWIWKANINRIQVLHELIEYGQLYALTGTIGYALLRDRLNNCLILKQQSLTKLLATCDDVLECYGATQTVQVGLPVGLYKYFVFADEALEEKERPLLALFNQRLKETSTIPDLLQLHNEASQTLTPTCDFPRHVTEKIDQRRQRLRFEIFTHFDRPLTCGSIPELELRALHFAEELGVDDDVLHPLILEICFLFLAYKREFDSRFDVRDELISFKWCRLLGVRHVIPEMSRHLSRGAMLKWQDKLGQAIDPTSEDPFLTSVFARELEYIKSGTTDGKCIWDLLPASFELPLLPEEVDIIQTRENGPR